MEGALMHDSMDHLDPDTLRDIARRATEALRRQGVEPDAETGGKRRAPKPARIFQVPDGVKYLLPAQMTAWGQAFELWRDGARDERARLSRTRIWLLFLLLRYTGLRLGEALALDDRQDIDLDQGLVRVSGESGREVPMPETLVRALRHFFEAPMSLAVLGRVFHLDQGYVRRKFSEQGMGLPRELLNPRVLRHSRAVEMLREGVPQKIVDDLLGQRDWSQVTRYVDFSDADTQRFINHYIIKEKKMKTSARNMFVGQVSSIRHGMVVSEVELTTASGLKVVSVITKESFDSLGLSMGTTAVATVKAPWVVLVKEENKLKTSARNKFCGKISHINKGKIAVEVVVDLADGSKVTSLITDESATGLDLKVGDAICTLVKAFSVILTVE